MTATCERTTARGAQDLSGLQSELVGSSDAELDMLKRDRGWYVGYFWGVVAIGTLPLWFPIFLAAVYSIPVWRWKNYPGS